MDLNWIVSRCCLSAAAANHSLAWIETKKQKFISLSSHLSEAEWTCLFYTGCGDAVLRYIRDRPLAVVMTTAVLRGFGSFTCWDLSLHLLLLTEDRAERSARRMLDSTWPLKQHQCLKMKGQRRVVHSWMSHWRVVGFHSPSTASAKTDASRGAAPSRQFNPIKFWKLCSVSRQCE